MSRLVMSTCLGLLGLLLLVLASVTPAPAPAEASGLLRWAYLVNWDASSPASLRANIDKMDVVSPFWFGMDGDGNIVRNDHSEALMQVMRGRVRIVPTVKNSVNGAAFSPVLRDPARRSAAVGRMIELVERYGYDGIHTDFEDMLPADRAAFTAFQTELWERLKPRGKMVTVTLNAKTTERFDGFAGAHDYAAHARINDLILIQAYGFRVAGSPTPGPGAPIDWVRAVLNYSLSTIPREKLLLGVPWYGFTWNVTKGPPAQSISYTGAMTLRDRHNGTLGYDEATQTPWLRYTFEGDQYEAWFEDQRSLNAKLQLAAAAGIRGVGGWRLGFEDPASWSTWPSGSAPTPATPTPAPSPTPTPPPPPGVTVWQRGYPELGREGCTWYVAQWSDGTWTRTPWTCPAGVIPQRQDRAISADRGYPERGTEGCTWYVTRWADSTFTRVPFSCPPGVYARKPGDSTAMAPQPAPAPVAGASWQRGYPEVRADGCTWYVALWSDGIWTGTPWSCPPGRVPQRPDRAVALDRRYPEVGREGCTWYVSWFADGHHSKVPFSCPAGVTARR